MSDLGFAAGKSEPPVSFRNLHIGINRTWSGEEAVNRETRKPEGTLYRKAPANLEETPTPWAWQRYGAVTDRLVLGRHEDGIRKRSRS